MKELKNLPVLVPQAESLGMIGVIRSLGRSGLKVHAISSRENALGLRSKYVYKAVVCPEISHPEFSEWIRDYCDTEKIHTLVPTENIMLALRTKADSFKDVLPFSINLEIINLAYSKARTHLLYQANNLLENTPNGLVFTKENIENLQADLKYIQYPAYIKTDTIDSISDHILNGTVERVTSAKVSVKVIRKLLCAYSHVLIQESAEGKGAGVNCLRWKNDYIATFVNYCEHESPYTGGLSTLRKTWDFPAMQQDAEKRLNLLGWNGVAMVEYKIDDKTNSFSYIEINARFWAALHLALYAGADFPLYLVAAHAGVAVEIPKKWKDIQCCYDVPGEVAHVSSMLKDSNIDIGKKIVCLAGFFSNYINPRTKFDLHFPGDRRLYYLNMARFFGMEFKK